MDFSTHWSQLFTLGRFIGRMGCLMPLFFFACDTGGASVTESELSHPPLEKHPHYRLGHPDQRYELPGSLQEISGLSYLGKDRLACIQDEKGKTYVFDLNKKEVSGVFPFAGNGDFEGIEAVDDYMYAIKSDGSLLKISDWQSEDPQYEKLPTGLNKKHNVEGLGYRAENQTLLIACKGGAGTDKGKQRAIYSFALSNQKLSETPLWTINPADFGKKDNFGPSGIALHPLTGEVYVLSSQGKVLITLDSKGEIKAVYKLDKELYRQPEGICFSPEGDLFISNEGKRGKAYILHFKWIER